MSARRLLWQGADSWLWVVVLVVAVATAAALIFTLHAYERKLVSPRLGKTLLMLRGGVIFCIFLALLEPVLSWTTSQERTGRIIVAVDASQSMDTVDVQATPAEKLRWARAIGLIGNQETDARLNRWIAAYEKNQTPEWVTNEEEPDPQKRRLLADARGQNIQSLLREMDSMSRKDLVQRLLGLTRDGLLKQLKSEAEVDLVVFGGSSLDADAANLAATLKQPPQLILPQQTDIGQAVRAALAHGSQGKLEGIVVLSDGRNSTEKEKFQTGEVNSEGNVPIYSVLIGSERKPKDLAIAVLESPPTAFLHDKPVIRATVRTSGFAGTDVVVELQRLDKPDQPVEKKTLRPTGPTTDVEFAIDAEELGRRRYRLAAVVQPDETRTDNNDRQFTLQVVDDQARILLVDGEPRWEFRYLETALARDERVKVDAVVFRQPFMGLLPDTFFPRNLTLPEAGREVAESPFSKYDLVIIGDVPPQQFGDEVWKWLDRYVREEGGTLVLTAGKRNFPKNHRSEIVQSLMPVVDLKEETIDEAFDAGAPRDRGFHWRLTGDGNVFDVLKLTAEDADNTATWSKLPGHSWGLSGVAKPGATVWATRETRDAHPRLEWDRNHALFAQQYVGAGQVVWLGVDSTWRWRYGVGDEIHHKFWGQLGRWAADFKSAVGNEFVRFGLDRPNIAPGEETTVRARWDAKLLRKFPGLKAKARVMRLRGAIEEEAATIELKAAPGRPFIFEGKINRLKPGEYRVRLETEEAKVGDTPVQAELLVTEPVTPELADVSANADWLGDLAQASKGRLFRAQDVHELPNVFQHSTESISQHEQVAIWNHWTVLLILFALLFGEWVLRKLNGLP